MAREMLAQGKGRTTACSRSAGSARYSNAATHCTVHAGSGDLTGYRLDHGHAQGDRENTLNPDSPQSQRLRA